MKKLTVLAAAFAAGMTSFAANAMTTRDSGAVKSKVTEKQEERQAQPPETKDKSAIARTPLFGNKETTTDEKKAAGKQASKNGEIARTPLFGKAAEPTEARTPSDAKQAADVPKEKKSAKKKVTNKKQVAKKDAGKEKQVTKKDVGKKRIAKKGAGDKQVAEKSADNKQVAKNGGKEKSRSTKTDKPNIKAEVEAEIDLMKTASVSAKAETGSGRPYGSIVAQYASSYGVPVALAHAVIQVESNYRPNARGKAGEIGLMQIKPATARMMGYSGGAQGLFDPATNIKYGMKYLAKARELGGGTTCGTILKYNAGHGAKRMNPVSSAYCKKVKVHLGV